MTDVAYLDSIIVRDVSFVRHYIRCFVRKVILLLRRSVVGSKDVPSHAPYETLHE